jgi:putative hemolysin
MLLGVEIFLLALFFTADTYFSAAETSLSALSPMTVRRLREEHPGLAAILSRHLENPGRLLTTVIASSDLCTIGFSFMASGLTAQVVFSQKDHPHVVLTWSISYAISILLLLTADITPKVLAKHYAVPVALAVLPRLAFFDRLLGPLVRLFLWLINLLSRPFGLPLINQVPVMTEKDLRQILLEGEIAGVLEGEEREMIHSVMEFSNTLVREVMVPREEMFCINLSTSLEVCLDKLIDGGYSRAPVYKDNLDTIVGVLYSKDFLSVLKNRDLILLKDALRPAYFIPGTRKVSELLREFKRGKIHLAVVVDDKGAVAGLVTLEDLLEEIVGEIYDEYDTVAKAMEILPDGSVMLDARSSVRKVNVDLGAGLPERMDAATINALVILLAKRVPLPGEYVEAGSVRLTVMEATSRRVSRVRLIPTGAGKKGS